MYGYFLHIKSTEAQEIMLYLGALASAPENKWGGRAHTQNASKPAIESVLCGWSKFNLISKTVNPDGTTDYLFSSMISQDTSYMLINDFIDTLAKEGMEINGVFLGKAAHPSEQKTPEDFFYYNGKTLITSANSHEGCEWLFIPSSQEKERIWFTPELYSIANEMYFIDNGQVSSLENFVNMVNVLKKEFTAKPPKRKSKIG